MSSRVDRYLAAVNTPKQRGRKVSAATLAQRLTDAQAAVKTARGVEKLMAAQAVRDLQGRIAQINSTSDVDIKSLEVAFVRVAKKVRRESWDRLRRMARRRSLSGRVEASGNRAHPRLITP
jgi:hypothetical protein